MAEREIVSMQSEAAEIPLPNTKYRVIMGHGYLRQSLLVVAAATGCALAACGGGDELTLSGEDCTAENAFGLLRGAVVKVTTERSTATGFVVGSDQVVTNAHVVAGAKAVSIQFSDGRVERVSGDEIRGDSLRDIAVVPVDTKDASQAAFGDPDDLAAGRELLAVGYPLDLPGDAKPSKGIFQGRTDVYLQTDAPVNPGNSGGPLADLCARVVGVVTAGIADAQSIGLAIPIDEAQRVADLVRNGLGEPIAARDGGKATTGAGANGGESFFLEIAAENTEYDVNELTAPAGANVTLVFDNDDPGIQHNWSLYETEESETALFEGEILTGVDSQDYEFTAPEDPGTYHFHCDIHPSAMTGELIIE